VTGAWNGGSWLGCGDLPAMGEVFYLGAGWPQWKPLGILGTLLPLKRGSWLNINNFNNFKQPQKYLSFPKVLIYLLQSITVCYYNYNALLSNFCSIICKVVAYGKLKTNENFKLAKKWLHCL